MLYFNVWQLRIIMLTAPVLYQLVQVAIWLCIRHSTGPTASTSRKWMTSPRLRSNSTSSGTGKAKMTKMLVECRREGILRHLATDGADGTQPQWNKCRLVLVRTTGGDLLEFYIPPKVHSMSQSCFVKCHFI
jgi:hypothetical protein